MRVAIFLVSALIFTLACMCGGSEPELFDATRPIGTEPGTEAGASAAPTGRTPPKVTRKLDALTYRGSLDKGDFLVALDYTAEGWGNYGFLYDDGRQVWVVEGDTVVGGPFAENGPEIATVTANWTAFEKNRHNQVMQGIAAMPHGCLEGCAFEVYDASGGFKGYRIEY